MPSLELSSTVPSMAYSRAPSLGLVLYLLKNSTADFFQFHQSHRQSLGKLQSLDQLPPEELKEVILDDCALPEVVSVAHLFLNHDPVSGFVFAVVPRSGVRHWRGGENLIGPKEPPGQETPGPADQQQSQAAGPLLMYPSTHCRRNSRNELHPPHASSALTLFLQMLSRPACLSYGATLSTTCCIARPPTPRIP